MVCQRDECFTGNLFLEKMQISISKKHRLSTEPGVEAMCGTVAASADEILFSALSVFINFLTKYFNFQTRNVVCQSGGHAIVFIHQI